MHVACQEEEWPLPEERALTHLDKVVDEPQRQHDNGKIRRGQADDQQSTDNAQETVQPGAE